MLLTALSALLLLAVSCTESLEGIQATQSALERSETSDRAFSYSEERSGRKVEVRGRIEDAFRYEATLIADGTRLFHQVVSDDSVALRLLGPEQWVPEVEDPELAAALARGDWVVDPQGAPPVHLSGVDRLEREVGDDPVSDAMNVFIYVREAIRQSPRVVEFDPESIFYMPTDDPFRHLVDRDMRAGIERYDLVRFPLPRGEGPGADLPTTRHFRKMSIYVLDGRVVRILEDIEIAAHEEYRRARERGEPRFLLEQMRTVLAGMGPERVRERRMSIEFTYPDEPVGIAFPQGAVMRLPPLLGPAPPAPAVAPPQRGEQAPAGSEGEGTGA